jgi:hypothetical protein
MLYTILIVFTIFCIYNYFKRHPFCYRIKFRYNKIFSRYLHIMYFIKIISVKAVLDINGYSFSIRDKILLVLTGRSSLRNL